MHILRVSREAGLGESLSSRLCPDPPQLFASQKIVPDLPRRDLLLEVGSVGLHKLLAKRLMPFEDRVELVFLLLELRGKLLTAFDDPALDDFSLLELLVEMLF